MTSRERERLIWSVSYVLKERDLATYDNTFMSKYCRVTFALKKKEKEKVEKVGRGDYEGVLL